MKRPKRKLEFRKEIVKLLDPRELARAVGGYTTAITCTCAPTVTCSEDASC